jgi:hypothetical protein
MKVTFFSLLALTFAHSAFAATYRGHCAHPAEMAAIHKWANVPNPSDQLEFMTMSSEETSRGAASYTVVLALSDGNESNYAKYLVVFDDVESCSAPTVTATR